MNFFPQLAFASYVGKPEKWFAWKPVKLWSGAWIWLRTVERRVALVHWHLTPGGGDTFWVYSKGDREGGLSGGPASRGFEKSHKNKGF